MYRKRLRSSAGCMRCKNRHHKCDEKRPRCSFCARHNVACIWPTQSQQQQRKREQQQQQQLMAMVASQKSSVLSRQVARDVDAPSLDPFHVMPVHYSEDISTISDRLHAFFTGITESTLPFDVKSTHHELTRGWLASVHADEAVCTSFVAYCAWFYSERTTHQSKLISLSLSNEARSLALLRRRIQEDETVTDGTLLAAALHFFIATLSTKSVSQLTRIAQGISALVAAKGGARATMRYVSPSTRQSLIFVDVFNSLLSAQKPFLGIVELPARPPSYNSLFPGSVIDEDIANCLGQELTDVLKNLRFALFFRAPSQQTRKLSLNESQYLFMLLQRISYGLCHQQSRFATSRSLCEIAVYGMILVKEEVLLDIVQHPVLPITILQRLKSVISTCGAPLNGIDLTVALWASMMALVGTEFESERTWALEFLTSTLIDRYGPSWPPGWITDTRKELERILWHSRIEVRFMSACTQLYHLHGHINDRVVDQDRLYEISSTT